MFKIGMYVRCPFDDEASSISDSRSFLLGQIKSINEETETATVMFHDHRNLRAFFTDIPNEETFSLKYLRRTQALVGTKIVFKEKYLKILSLSEHSGKENSYYTYFVEYYKDGKAKVGEVGEHQIEIPFTRANYNPASQMLRYEFHNPRWYLKRRIVSESVNMISNSPSGFKNLLGTRVHLFSHQVDTIVRALSENPCRLMLADEVGLGKTIEALSIIKGIMDKSPKMKTLIILPETLVYQWQTELSFKFWFNIPIWGIDKYIDESMLIVSSENLIENFNEIYNINKWDMCIIDEAHKLLSKDELYNVILALCEKIENTLLLSATPILQRGQEYKKLLTLLNPARFKDMADLEFNDLLGKQKIIRDIVFDLMRDLPDYIEYELYDQFIDGLNEINDEINDVKFVELISKIDKNKDDFGLFEIKMCLAYISEFYQIERGIIRHRRAEIESANIQRELIDISYEMAASDVGFYEENFYHSTLEYIESNLEQGMSISKIQEFLAVISSSPFAVIEFLHNNQGFKLPENCNVYLQNWLETTQKEIESIKNVSDDIDNFHSKFAKVVDFIDQEDTTNKKKFLIFTSFTSTAEYLLRCFNNFFPANTACSFHSKMSLEDMQESATLFQNIPECRFMICDESGGEGRNFQEADYIIHFDLPWSPALLEQRIGRLDRIGRDISKSVISVVIYAENSIENDLFNIYNDGLNVFSNSLCGMEIAFEQIHDTIQNALFSDLKFGLSNVLNEIKEFSELMNSEIERERYFDLARQLDINLQDKIDRLINHFTIDDGEQLMDTMMAWPSMAGFSGINITNAFKDGSKVVSVDTTDFSIRSMQKSLYFPPKMDEIIKRSKYKNDIRGTFSRSSAVKHENLTFLAPFNPLFDSITENASECYKGRCVALRIKECRLKWQGILTTWNVKFNPQKVFELGLPADLITHITRYFAPNQINHTVSLGKQYSDINTDEITDLLKELQDKNTIHLGKRDNKNIDNFKQAFPPEQWNKFIKKVYQSGISFARQEAIYALDSAEARKYLEQIYAANKAIEVYYGYTNKEMVLNSATDIDALIYGLENPIIELDSIAFLKFD